MSVDVAIPGDRSVIKKEAEKILKYEDLTIEIQPMWNNSCTRSGITNQISYDKYITNRSK